MSSILFFGGVGAFMAATVSTAKYNLSGYELVIFVISFFAIWLGMKLWNK